MIKTKKPKRRAKPKPAAKDGRRAPGPKRLPGDPDRDQMIRRMLRVNQAGEYGAVRIYEGQLAVLGGTESAPVIRDMAEQERRHLEAFNKLIPAHRVRPTALMPLWHLAGFALGAGTALMGEKAAMAATAAVEDVIEKHYAAQAEELQATEPVLAATVAEFREDELGHKATAQAHGAEEAPGYPLMRVLIKAGCLAAIRLSEKI